MWWMPSRAMAGSSSSGGWLCAQRAARLVAYTTTERGTRRRRRCYRRVEPAGTRRLMATEAQTSSTRRSAAEAVQLDERELRAWRGMLRVHATLTKALDAELEAA